MIGPTSVGDQLERLPGRLEAVLQFSVRWAEHERVQHQLRPALQDRREPPLIEGNASGLRILGVGLPAGPT
jgi:hypothetical protein